jgi:hypothetical protein
MKQKSPYIEYAPMLTLIEKKRKEKGKEKFSIPWNVEIYSWLKTYKIPEEAHFIA